MQPEFNIADVVRSHFQVNSNSELGLVQKLSYRERGIFQITAALGKNPYEVKRYNRPDSESRKYRGTELYLLPHRMFPHDPLDTTDQRYLNYNYAPVTSPLKTNEY